MKTALRILFVFWGVCLTAAAKDPRPYAGFDEAFLDTPPPAGATIWGRPLKGGPIRTLVIAPRFTLLDAVGLVQRLDLDMHVAPVWDATHLGNDASPIPGVSAEDTAARLRESLSDDHDVVIIGNIDLSILPEDVIRQLVDKVAGGCGLVLAHHRTNLPAPLQEFLDAAVPAKDDAPVTRGIGAAHTPEWPLSLGFVRALEHPAGRCVALEYPGGRPFTHFLLPALTDPMHARRAYLDTYFSLVAKALRWAAGRDSDAWIASIETPAPLKPKEEEIPPGFPEEYVQALRDGATPMAYQPFRVLLNAPAEKAYGVRAAIRDPDRGLRREFLDLPRVAKGEESYLLEVPVGAGRYFLDVWLLDRNRVVDWFTHPVEVKGWPEVTRLAYSKGYLLANDALTVSLEVRPHYERPRSCVAGARATDSLGRLVAEAYAVLPPQAGSVDLHLEFADLIANLIRVDVFVADTRSPRPARWERERAAYHHAFYLPVRTAPVPGALHLTAEGRALGEYNARHYLGVLAKAGVDAICAPATNEVRFYLAKAALRPVPLLTRPGFDGHLFPWFLNPESFESETAELRDRTTAFWTVGTSRYLLDAPARSDSVRALGPFRAMLRGEYADLAQLNKSWGKDFATWDAVVPATREAAVAAGRYASWVDFQRFLDRRQAAAYAAGRDIVQDVDIDARVGVRAGARGVRAGARGVRGIGPIGDWSLVAPRLDVLAVPCDPVTVAKVRSYYTQGARRALIWDTPQDGRAWDRAAWLPWYQLMHGMQGAWISSPFAGAEAVMPAPPLTPDGRPSRVLERALSAMRQLDNGTGALLIRSQRATPAIAVYDSPASLHLDALLPAGKGRTRDAQADWIQLLNHLGYPFDFVAPTHAKEGRLTRYKLLILPGVRVLDDDEAAAIRAFHEAGGYLVADIAPGGYDGHGAVRSGFPLDGLFGVRSLGSPMSVPPADVMIEIARDGLTAKGVLQHVVPSQALEPEEAAAAGAVGGTPVWLLRGAGPGGAALLNHPLPGYEYAADGSAALRSLFGALLASAGLEPPAQVEFPRDGAFPGQWAQFEYGKARLVVLLADPGAGGKKYKVRVNLGGHEAVYDLREGKRVPRPGKIGLKMAPGDAALFAALPYEVSEVAIAAPAAVPAGRRLPVGITIKTKGALPGAHLVHVALSAPGGAPIPYYARDVECRGGEGSTYFSLALDEAPGFYRIEARDALSGVIGQAVVRVLPPKPGEITQD